MRRIVPIVSHLWIILPHMIMEISNARGGYDHRPHRPHRPHGLPSRNSPISAQTLSTWEEMPKITRTGPATGTVRVRRNHRPVGRVVLLFPRPAGRGSFRLDVSLDLRPCLASWFALAGDQVRDLPFEDPRDILADVLAAAMGVHHDPLKEIVLEVNGPARAQLALLGGRPPALRRRGRLAFGRAVRLDFRLEVVRRRRPPPFQDSRQPWTGPVSAFGRHR